MIWLWLWLWRSFFRVTTSVTAVIVGGDERAGAKLRELRNVMMAASGEGEE